MVWCPGTGNRGELPAPHAQAARCVESCRGIRPAHGDSAEREQVPLSAPTLPLAGPNQKPESKEPGNAEWSWEVPEPRADPGGGRLSLGARGHSHRPLGFAFRGVELEQRLPRV